MDSQFGNKIVSLPDVVPEEPGMLESLKKHVVSVVVGIAVIVVIIAAVRITCKKIIKFIMCTMDLLKDYKDSSMGALAFYCEETP